MFCKKIFSLIIKYPDPDPYWISSTTWILIRIEEKSWIWIRIKRNTDPKHWLVPTYKETETHPEYAVEHPNQWVPPSLDVEDEILLHLFQALLLLNLLNSFLEVLHLERRLPCKNKKNKPENQCCSSGMFCSGSGYHFSEFRIRL